MYGAPQLEQITKPLVAQAAKTSWVTSVTKRRPLPVRISGCSRDHSMRSQGGNAGT
jgi:hypothetical protein